MRRLLRPAFAALVGMAVPFAVIPTVSRAQISIGVSVNFAPPPLPVYDQPAIPGPDFIWVPGYWAWSDDIGDYYWVPGTWDEAPEPGLLWTPAWWGWNDGAYVFHDGYWGPHIGFYGGVAYGFGYDGEGYQGGYWQGRHFFYNRSVNHITNVNITNVYTKTVVVNQTTHVSFNGPGGATARPTPQQQAVLHERHVPPTAMQVQHIKVAASNPALHASTNHGAPPIAATAKPAAFTGPGVVKARAAGGAYHPPPPGARAKAAARPGAPNPVQAQEHPAAVAPAPGAARPHPLAPEAAAPARPPPAERREPATHPAANAERPRPPQPASPMREPREAPPPAAAERRAPGAFNGPAAERAARPEVARPDSVRPEVARPPAAERPAPPRPAAQPTPPAQKPPPKRPEEKEPRPPEG